MDRKPSDPKTAEIVSLVGSQESLATTREQPMFGLQILDIAIGVTFVYIVLSLVCSVVLEMWSQARGMRAKTLRCGITNLIGGGDERKGEAFTNDLFQQPVIGALKRNKREPSYIPSNIFIKAAFDKIVTDEGGFTPPVKAEIRKRLASSPTPVARVFLSYFDETGGNLPEMKARMEAWYNASMDRVSGWYKRWTAPRLLLIAAIVALAMNADTFRMIRVLNSDPETRQAIVDSAIQTAQGEDISQAMGEELKLAAKEGVIAIDPFIGWTKNEFKDDWGTLDWTLAIFTKFLGLTLTALAISLGAPFWFDVLQKLVRIRGSAKPDEAKKAKPAGNPLQPQADSPPGTTPAIIRTTGPDAQATPEKPAPEAAPPNPDAYLRGMVGFDPYTAERSHKNAYWLAKISQLAYEPDATQLQEEARALGLRAQAIEVTQSDGTILNLGGTDVQAIVLSDSVTAIVAFRGTEPAKPADLITDAALGLVTSGTLRGKLHKGFTDYVDKIWDVLEPAIREHTREGQSLWFTGHSLGGALAVIAAARWSTSDTAGRAPAMIRGVYTFGQPRVGDRDFVDWYESRLGKITFRYVNNRDIVTRVPTRLNGYPESGTVFYFDERGKLRTNPGFWFRFLDTVAVTQDEVRERGKETIGDHAIGMYVELLGLASA